MIQWSGAFLSPEIYNFLPLPWHFFLVAHVIPLIIIICNLAIGNLWVKSIWDKVNQPLFFHKKGLASFFWFFLFITIAFNIYYFYKIPFTSTGLYKLFTSPLTAAIAREESLKLVPDFLIRYGYNLVRSVIAPILAIIIVMLYLEKRKKVLNVLLYSSISIIGLLYILFVVSLTGARSGPAGVAFCVLVAVYISKGMPIKTRYVLIGFLVVLSFPVIITIMREGKDITMSSFFEYLFYLFNRVFVTPMRVGLWHMHYAQTNGIVGIGGVRPLALIFGVEYIYLANIIGLTYVDNPLATIHSDTGFFFDYYACFGLYTVIISIFLTFLLDFMLPILRRYKILLIPLLSLIFFKTINFVESTYTVTLLTHGFLLIPVLIFFNIFLMQIGTSIKKLMLFIRTKR